MNLVLWAKPEGAGVGKNRQWDRVRLHGALAGERLGDGKRRGEVRGKNFG